jgi:hypothetical protein
MFIAVCMVLSNTFFGCSENQNQAPVKSVYLCSNIEEEKVKLMELKRLRFNEDKNCFALHLKLDEPFVEYSHNLAQQSATNNGYAMLILILSDGYRRGVRVRPVGYTEIEDGTMSSLIKGVSPESDILQTTREIFHTYYQSDVGKGLVSGGDPYWRMTKMSKNYLAWISRDEQMNLLCANPKSEEMIKSGIACQLYVRVLSDVVADFGFSVGDAERAFSDITEISELIKKIVVEE